MMNSIKKLIGTARSTEATSVSLAAALEEAESEILNAESQYAVAGKAYEDGLLHLEEDHLMGLMADRQKATIRRERAQVLVHTLQARLAETRKAELVAALDTERDAATKEAVAAADAVRTQYPKLAKALVDMLERIEAADNTLSAVNRKLVDAGRHRERIQDVQSRVIPDGQFNIWGTTQLMEFANFAPGWRSPVIGGGVYSFVTPDSLKRAPDDIKWKAP